MSWRIRQRLGGTLLLYLVSVFSVCSFSNDTLISNHTITEEIPEVFANISNDNVLWNSLIRDCKNPTFSCIQNSMYQYLDNVLEHTNNYEVGGFLKLTKNNVTYNEQEINEADGNDAEKKEEEEGQEERSTRSSPLEEVTSAFHEKAIKFMITHDMAVQLPDMLFEGSTLQISPRHFADSGLVAKLELTPRIDKEVGTPRIFFKKIKKIIGEKLMNALMAILLVISLLSAKFMFFTPMVMGVAAAKKLLLKLLLFFFPFLAHIFKLCPYYEPHQPTKFHHHHHQIAHLHHIPPPHILKHPPILDHHEHHDHHDHHEHYDNHDPHHDHFEIGLDYYSEGPEFTNEFISHRKTDKHPGGTKDDNNIYSWIAGQGQEAKRPRKPQMNRPLTPAEIEKLALKAEKEAVLKVRLQQEHQRVLAENKLLQEQIKQGLKVQEKLRLQASLVQQKRHADALHLTPGVLGGPVSGLLKPSQVLQTPPINQALLLKASQNNPTFSSQIPQLNSLQIQQISQALPLQTQLNQAFPLQTQMTQALPAQTRKQTFSEALQQAAAITFDSFYSPILEKIDKVLTSIGFIEESCRERLICSMYKNPTKFSPHSNLVSAQLSRDASELQKPATTNAAVIRFYRYVQAARDGQDKRECLRLYPSCSVNTEL